MRNIVQFNVLNNDFQNDPYPTYSMLHSTNSILMDSHLNAHFFGHYDDVAHILRSPAFTTAPLADRAQPVMGDRVLAQMEGAEHYVKRRTVLGALTGKRFREHYAQMIEQVVEELLSQTSHTGRIDLINEFGKDYSILVTLKILGLPTDRHKDIAAWHQGVASFITNLAMTQEQRNSSLRCSKEIIDYLTPLIEGEQHDDDSFITMLCNSEHNGQPMKTSEVVALILNVILAASEPADKTLGYLFNHLLGCPGRYDTVKEDRRLLVPAIRETLRLTPPVQLIPRQTDTQVQVGGVDLPKGSLVFCMIGAANRDPAIYDQPSSFVIDRKQAIQGCPEHAKAASHLAFGAGKHVCVGAAFSLLQIELTANLLMDRLQNPGFAPGFSFQEEGLYTRGPASLTLEFLPYDSTVVSA